jgi:hypothetical protein
MAFRPPVHVDNYILIPGESYIPSTRIQPIGRNETGILTMVEAGKNSQHIRRPKIVSGASCDEPQCESKVLIIGREILGV